MKINKDGEPEPSLTDIRLIGRDTVATSRVLECFREELRVVAWDTVKRCPWLDLEDVIQEGVVLILSQAKTYNPKQGTFRAYALSALWMKFGGPTRGGLRPSLKTVNQFPDIEDPSSQTELLLVEVKELLSILTPQHRQLIEDRFGINRPERSINQIAALRNSSPQEVRKGLQESLAILRTQVI